MLQYYSRTLNTAEQNYDVASRELLAIISAVRHFRPYLFGRKFKIVTDNLALKYLDGIKDGSSRLLRYRLILSEYDYYVEHRPGNKLIEMQMHLVEYR